MQPDPPQRFRCPGCTRLLTWKPRSVAAEPMQLDLFGESVPTRTNRRRTRPAETPDLLGPVTTRSQSVLRSQQDVLAAVTELFYDEPVHTRDGLLRARACFDGRSSADLREAAFSAAFMLAATLRLAETGSPGAGVDMLQTLGLVVAGMTVD